MPRTRPPSPVAIDFETFGIESRPHYPPVPVSVSIGYPGKPVVFLAWGHVNGGNNCTWGEARGALVKAWAWRGGVLFHNAKFDSDVAETHFGLSPLPWGKIHDTVFLLFLDNPHALNLGLKESAQRLLDCAPGEKDAVADWLTTHQPVPGVKIGAGANSKEPAGKYIAFAPGDVVGPYANGDVRRTVKLFEKLWVSVCVDRKMLKAYDRERELMPVLLESERNGVRVDLPRLERDIAIYDAWMGKLDAWLRKELGDPQIPTKARKGQSVLFEPLNIDADQQLVKAMVDAGKADVSKMGQTPKGAVAASKEAIRAGVTDKVFGAVLIYRNQLKTCLATFMKTWAGMARASSGFIYSSWNQTRGNGGGARTGRLSSSPNFQNIAKDFPPLFQCEKNKDLPKCPWRDLPPLPLCRSYIIPYTDDDLLLDRDYSQQEIRILGHFEGGLIQEQYQADPWIDFHDTARDYVEKATGKAYTRKAIKGFNFSQIYGAGIGKTAESLGITLDEAKDLRATVYRLYPGMADLNEEMRRRDAANQPIRTWGGREYYCEPGAYIEKYQRFMTFSYRMLNCLIQGSAADCTKEGLCRFQKIKKPTWRVLFNVHDSVTVSAPRGEAVEAMEALRVALESVEFDVKMLSEGSWSGDNWASMSDWDKKGMLIYGAV